MTLAAVVSYDFFALFTSLRVCNAPFITLMIKCLVECDFFNDSFVVPYIKENLK